MQKIAAIVGRIGPRHDHGYGTGVICLGLAAYVLAGLHPLAGPEFWQMKLPLVCLAGLLTLVGAYALPATNRRWHALKLLIAAAAVHWMFVLPLDRYWHQF